MKVGILTHYNVNNQGAQLQLYALSKYLQEIGCDTYVQTYRKNFDFDTNDWEKRNEISVRSIGYIIRNFIFSKGIRLTWHNVKKYVINKKFREEYFSFIHYAKEHVDLSVIGSDEVFSLQVGVNIMMFGHAINADHVITYAPCIGGATADYFRERRCEQILISGLRSMDRVSVRDENTKSVVEELSGLHDIPVVCDPVMLYDFSNTHTSHKRIKSKYLLVYSYDRNFVDPKEIKTIKEYAKSKNLKTASVGTYHKWCDYNVTCNALEWLEYFRDSEEVVTNTFHGTVLAIITGKQFAFIGKQQKVKCLLTELDLLDRQMDTIEDLSKVMSKPIDSEKMNRNLESFRSTSRTYLGDAVKEFWVDE